LPKTILFIDSVHAACREELERAGFECIDYSSRSESETRERLRTVDGAVIRSRFKLTKEILQQCKNLKCVGRAGAGMENIDVAFAESIGICCVHAPEGNRDAVAEQAVGMLLMLLNNLLRANAEVRQGIWRREENRGVELMGKTVGIIGYGNMGAAFAQRLLGFGVKILAYDKYKKNFGTDTVRESKMDEVFRQSDIVSLHIPLTDETNALVNKDWLNSFHKPIVIINTARGKCLDTAALVDAMESGKVRGACLDVLEYESVSFETIHSKEIPAPLRYLFNSDKVVLSPHIAGWTHESNEKIARILAQRMIEVFDCEK
jgi:D-3-phosphoglycerate dehydrogenase / 2-oxoglutarate reductase